MFSFLQDIKFKSKGAELLTRIQSRFCDFCHNMPHFTFLYRSADKTLHTSEYVYLPNDGSGLCHTVNFQWKKNVDVHFLVTCKILMSSDILVIMCCNNWSHFLAFSAVKNLAQWAVHLFDNMEYVSARYMCKLLPSMCVSTCYITLPRWSCAVLCCCPCF